KRLLSLLVLSMFTQLSGRGVDSLYERALSIGTAVLELLTSSLEQDYENKNMMSQIKSYSQNYEDGTLVCHLPYEDYVKYHVNLNIIRDVYDNLLPNLIDTSKRYLHDYFGLSDNDVSELNQLFLANNGLPNFPLIHFNGSQAPENCNLEVVETNIYGVSPVYKVSYSDVIPIYIPNIENEILPVLALSGI